MNSFELNKVLGAGALFAEHKPAKPGYMIAVKTENEGGKPAAKAPEKPIGVLLASANVEKGQSIAKQCQSCHTFEKGGPNRVGPNLYNIVEDERGKDRGGFNFSAAMKAKGGEWTYEDLNHMIFKPQAFVKGTKMAFAGLPKEQDRADLIAYLRTMNDNPPPLPEAAPGGAAPAKPADDGKQPDKK